VDFPLPFVPIIATRLNGFILKDTLSSVFPPTLFVSFLYWNDTFLNSISPVIGISCLFPSFEGSTIILLISASFSAIFPYSVITDMLRCDAVLTYFTKNSIIIINFVVILLSIFLFL
jgi:hypothetical protein